MTSNAHVPTLSVTVLCRIGFALALLCFFAVLGSPAAHAQTFSVIHNFSGGADGATPYAGMVFDRAGNLYGTTPYGGTAGGCEGCGVVYKLSRSGSGWIVHPLYNFKGPAENDGESPNAGVTFGPDGRLYGTTFRGGANDYGTVYQLQPASSACKSAMCWWNETVLYHFANMPDGAYPGQGSVSFDAAGNLYGTTYLGGGLVEDCDDQSCGTAYEMSRNGNNWSESVICPLGSCSFPGFWPQAGLTLDSAGNLYGTVTNTSGGVFQLQPLPGGIWLSNALYNFILQPQYSPTGGLILDAAGNVYGTTAGGGTEGGGTVFELVRSGESWNFQVLYNFAYLGNHQLPGPQANLTMDAAGNLYGTTLFDGANDCGMVFKLSASGGSWNLTSLHDFTCNGDGGQPHSSVVLDGSGNLYGTAAVGGTDNSGVIWEITP